MSFIVVNPEELGAPRGWSNGILVPRDGRHLFVAGQTGVGPDGGGPAAFAAQFVRALDKVLTVVRAAGGEPQDVARMVVYVTDVSAYRATLKTLGDAWRSRFGSYYPAMALLEVKGLVDRAALVEIEATAVIGEKA